MDQAALEPFTVANRNFEFQISKPMSEQPTHEKLTGPESPHFCTDGDSAENVQGWTEIEEGRFMPRRVRGSGRGRALG